MTATLSALSIHRATPADAPQIATLVGALLTEISQAIGEQAFHFDLAQTTARLQDFMAREQYIVFVAHDGVHPVGLVTLSESRALYAGGVFGTLPEFYVRPAYRSQGVGRQLLDQVKAHARARGWTRLEVTTPPLPPFEPTLAFYEREGFTVTGGRKLKIAL